MVGKSGYFFIFKFRYRSILGKLFKQRITLIHLGIYVPTISMCVVIPIIRNHLSGTTYDIAQRKLFTTHQHSQEPILI
jgi:hypothetical protein